MTTTDDAATTTACTNAGTRQRPTATIPHEELHTKGYPVPHQPHQATFARRGV
ncbi:hypothetical protein OG331_47980 [Streptomyces sp. NBC_01017]|uniref:hypothetical protein n=1 Tax=Streptomyces sp. NBC_01017 TaxID=2903721 RepID=UPI0038642DF5|nr:hypothetical protein OG331_04000 [Streptomyces sp. NBC_01017]WSV34793.1 hypothetical protein OG331_47980 [Streptomyces sp. NBC_01017]